MWEPDTLRAGPAGPGRSEDGMSGKKKSGSARAVPRAYGRLTRHERDTVQRMLERRASCREIARELGRSPSTVSAEVASHRFATAPKARRGERVDATAQQTRAKAEEVHDPEPTPSQRKHQNDLVRKLNNAGKGRAGRKA